MELEGRRIRIGIGAPLTGSSSVLGKEMAQAVQLAIEERRSSGGALAKAHLIAEVADDAGAVDVGERLARAFCADPEMLGVVGHYNSDVTLATIPIYEAAGLAMITPIASNPGVTQGGARNVFRFTNRDDETGIAMAQYLFQRLQKRRALVVKTPTTYGSSMAREFMHAFRECGGKVLDEIEVQEGNRDFSALVRGFPPDFDVLFYGGSFEGAYILRAMRAARLTQLFAAGDGCWDLYNFLQPATEASSETLTAGEGVLVLSATPEPGRVPGSREFIERYAKRFGPVGNYAVNSYDSACLLLQGIEHAAQAAAGLPTRAQVASAVRAIRYPGIAYSRPVQWSPRGDNLAAVTALHVVEGRRFKQVAEIPQRA